MNLAKSQLTALLLLLATIVAISPLIHAFSPIKGNVVFVLALLTLLITKSLWKGLSKTCFIVCLGIVLLAVIPALYWQEPRIMLIPTYFVLSLMVVSVLNKNDIRIFVDLLTWVVLVVLCGAVIGTSYAYLGGGAILDFANPDGRLNQVYLTTLTNIQIENFIRPSGIFDEPGALSFIVCFVAALRHSLGYDKKITWVLLTCGFVTTSVAHLVYTLLHATQELKDHKRAKDILTAAVILICSLLFLALFQASQEIISTFILRRFPYDLANLGQDRITTLMNAVSYININTFFFGLDSD